MNMKQLTVVAFCLLLTGCAVGRGPAGEIVVGVPLGTLVDTSEQAIIGGAGMIPVVGPFIQKLLIGAAAGGATTAGVAKLVLAKLEAKRKASDIARELAERELAVAEAKLNGGANA
jgi:hypothetical protein